MSVDTLLAQMGSASETLIVVAHFFVALYLSISVHEAAHAWMAHRCGDDTARLMGRMTLNPIAHIDPIGTVLMPIMMIVGPMLIPGGRLGVPLLAWAKPVPVNPVRFRNMRRGEILVSLAGPASNFILAACGVVASWLVLATMGPAQGLLRVFLDALATFLGVLVMLNIALMVFNLIPIPPLDGSHILGAVLSREAARNIERFLMPPFNLIILLFIVVPLVRPVFDLLLKAAAFLIGVWGS